MQVKFFQRAAVILAFVFASSLVSALELSPEESAYLDSREEFLICVDPDWLPFEAIEDGKHIGIAADYFAEFSQILNKRFTLLETKSWTESVETAKAGNCDILTILNETPERLKFLNFTEPYVTTSVVIVSKEDVYVIDSLSALEGKTLAVPENYFYVEYLQRDYPDINLVYTQSQKESIKKVSTGQVFATIGTQVTLLRDLQQLAISNVKVASFTEYKSVLRVGVKKSDMLLHSIMSKVVNEVPRDMENKILQRWYSVKVEQDIDATVLWQIMAASFAIFIILYLQIRNARNFNKVLREKNKELERISQTDHLTGVYNRLKTDQVIKNEVSRAERYGSSFSIMLFDIDHFKQINDSKGHQVGDVALVQLCNLVKSNIRETDLLGRWGGEEFMLVCPELSAAKAGQLAEKLRGLIENHSFPHALQITVSFGVAEYRNGDKPDELLSQADKLLYKAKDAGRNRVALS
ncbi:diguanylate cyclase [Neptuniibacter sp.]|uniref:diguanylate cyclase n=1 Tax=Neptuniibacter sp. TaxID=1962643 RepID=UPI00261DD780|nr:diguanylate cyclase [Neptuniibacter sp.]MCP4596563.1 diguanylate cyclase [Neptuniibacter sp.]